MEGLSFRRSYRLALQYCCFFWKGGIISTLRSKFVVGANGRRAIALVDFGTGLLSALNTDAGAGLLCDLPIFYDKFY